MKQNITLATRQLAEHVVPECDFDGEKFTSKGVSRFCRVGLHKLQHIFPEDEIPMRLEQPTKLKIYESLRGCSFYEWTHEINVRVQFDPTLIWRVACYLIANEVSIIPDRGIYYNFYTADQEGDVLCINLSKSYVDDCWSLSQEEPREILNKGELIYVLA